MRAWLPQDDAVTLMGGLPDGVDADVYSGSGPLPPSAAEVEFYVPPFAVVPSAIDVVGDLPSLRVVQLMNAGVDTVIDRIPAQVTLCDGRGIHDVPVAEWVLAAMLASVRDIPAFVRAQGDRRWDYHHTDGLTGKTVLIVGFGSIGAAVEARLATFEASVLRVARHSRPGVDPVDALPDLLPRADVVLVLLPLTAATRGLVDAGFLARMRDGALFVNASRGPVVDTDALVAEVRAGRLRAALDVTDPEPLPPEHPLWTLPGVLITPHVASSTPALIPRAFALVRRQLDRYVRGEPLDNVVSEGY